MDNLTLSHHYRIFVVKNTDRETRLVIILWSDVQRLRIEKKKPGSQSEGWHPGLLAAVG